MGLNAALLLANGTMNYSTYIYIIIYINKIISLDNYIIEISAQNLHDQCIYTCMHVCRMHMYAGEIERISVHACAVSIGRVCSASVPCTFHMHMHMHTPASPE